VFLGLLHKAPGGFSFFRPFRALSTAGEALRRAAVGSEQRAFGQSPPAMHSSVHRDRVAWAAETRSDVSLRSGTGHRSPPRVRNTADAPRMGRDAIDITSRSPVSECRRASVTDIP